MNKALQIAKTVAVWLVVAFAVGIMIFTLVSVITLDQNNRELFGYKFFIVRTDSMAATDFDAGDIAISREVDVTTLVEGDIITFVSQNPHNYGDTVTHKIREVTTDATGGLAFVTYGTTTNTNDEALATIIVGKYVGRIPKVGSFFMFLKTAPGYIFCIFLPFMLLILSQGLNCVRLFRQYRKEQLEEIQAERARIEEERAESQRLMAELQQLKAQLLQQEGQGKPSAPPSETTSADEA